MQWRNSASQYGWLSAGLHWLMLLLLAAVYATMELEDLAGEGSAAREAMETWHYMLGLSVLALLALRLAVRLASPVPAITPAPSLWQHRAATVVHIALYLFMLGMPLLGWGILSAEGEPIPFGLPPLTGVSESLEDWLEELHEIGATIGYILIGLHAAAALFHHYVMHDDTLRRILPRWR
ncbi:cytochrome b [Pseudoduganella sp. GCM10020061]|uniref:cytochrome b n=1 Tax=Pseudoduganella sp. GCM10020061 TaxID=3317345 RepID=UPI0036387809